MAHPRYLEPPLPFGLSGHRRITWENKHFLPATIYIYIYILWHKYIIYIYIYN